MKLLLTLVLIVAFGTQEIKAQNKQKQDQEFEDLKKELDAKINADPVLNVQLTALQKAVETQSKFLAAVSSSSRENAKLDSLDLIFFNIKKTEKNKPVIIDLLEKIKNQKSTVLKAKEIAIEAQQEKDVACQYLEKLTENSK